MFLGKNLQFLRRMHNRMTQEELAEKLSVSRQTVSKWELDAMMPEMDKVLEICALFGCTIDTLVREDMCISEEALSNIRTETLPAFRYVRYTVISPEPEDDALDHTRKWALKYQDLAPRLIGWDFPFLSQEQINVYHLHGYTAAWVLKDGCVPDCAPVLTQPQTRYAAVTITRPFDAPFRIIPNAYKTLVYYMQVNGLNHTKQKDIIDCFEYSYEKDGTPYMDVYIALE